MCVQCAHDILYYDLTSFFTECNHKDFSNARNQRAEAIKFEYIIAISGRPVSLSFAWQEALRTQDYAFISRPKIQSSFVSIKNTKKLDANFILRILKWLKVNKTK